MPVRTFRWQDPWTGSSAALARMSTQNLAMLWGAAEVIGMRTAMLAPRPGGPASGHLIESIGMVAEKPWALWQSSVSAWVEWNRVAQSMGLDWMRGGSGQASASAFARWSDASLRIADAAARPIRRKVASNRKRLRRTR